jgi:hypothetical protein
MNCQSLKSMSGYRLYIRPNTTVISIVIAMFVALSFAFSTVTQRLDGTLRVVVSDISGASVTDAKVTVTNEGTNVSQSTNASSGQREFSF